MSYALAAPGGRESKLEFGLLFLHLDLTHFGLVAASSRIVMSEYNYKTRLNRGITGSEKSARMYGHI